MSKKKVSFDIDLALLADIKAVCGLKEIKLAEFYRSAVESRLKEMKNSMDIFMISNNHGIQKATITPSDFTMTLTKASNEMHENVGAICEGTLIDPFKFPQTEEVWKILQKHLSEDKKIYFFTKENYLYEYPLQEYHRQDDNL